MIDFKELEDQHGASANSHLDLIEVKIVKEIVTYISQRDFTNLLHQLLPMKTYSIQVIIKLITKCVDFVELHRFPQRQEFLKQTIMVNLSY